MPQKRKPLSLYRICITTIAQTMDTIGYELFQKTKCSSEVLTEMIEELISSRLLKWCHLVVLIRSNLRRLNLSGCKIEIWDRLPNLISAQTQIVEHLDLSGCNGITPEVLCQLINHLADLKIVCFKYTRCNDAVLHRLWASCPVLVELNVSGCHGVTDAGFLTDKQNTSLLGLKRLCVFDTKMTKMGALFVLKSCPFLENFDFTNMDIVLPELYSQNIVNKKFPIECVLRTVHLVTSNMSDSDLIVLNQLGNLRELGLGNIDSQQRFTFAGGVLPVLEQLGKKLTLLSLSNLCNVDLVLVSKLCTSLNVLKLVRNKDYVNRDAGETNGCGFDQLKELEVACHSNWNLSEHHILLLLGQSHRLCSLFLQKCSALTDGIFTKLLHLNSLKCLHSLQLEYCDSVTAAIIHAFLNENNDLCEVLLFGCQLIQRSDCHEMEEFARRHNLDVKVTWSNLT